MLAARGRGRDVIAPAWKKPSGLMTPAASTTSGPPGPHAAPPPSINGACYGGGPCLGPGNLGLAPLSTPSPCAGVHGGGGPFSSGSAAAAGPSIPPVVTGALDSRLSRQPAAASGSSAGCGGLPPAALGGRGAGQPCQAGHNSAAPHAGWPPPAQPPPPREWTPSPHPGASRSSLGSRAPAAQPVPAPAQAPRSPRAWHAEEWRQELLGFANQPSVELEVLADQLGTGSGAIAAPRLACSQGEVVAGVARIPARGAEDALVWCVAYRDGLRREGAVPHEMCRPCGAYHFMLHVPLAARESLGIKGGVGPRGLEIQEVMEGGVVEKWNDGCARTLMRDVVRVGDMIVGANGYRDPVGALVALQGAGFCTVLVSRAAVTAGIVPGT